MAKKLSAYIKIKLLERSNNIMKRLEIKSIITIDCENENTENKIEAIEAMLNVFSKNPELQQINFKIMTAETSVYCCINNEKYTRYCSECEYREECEDYKNEIEK